MTMLINQEGIGFKEYDFTDKSKVINDYCQYMLDRTQSMFRYENLPDTIPAKFLELYAQYYGVVCIAKGNDDNLYAFYGGWGGKPDTYYQPTQFIVANPYQELNKTFTVGEDCVLLFNDSMYMGLKPMFEKYATQLVENDLTMVITDWNARIQTLLSADDDRTRESAEKFIRDIIDGKLGVVSGNAFMESLKAIGNNTNTNANQLTNLIEYHQYLKAGWFNDLGLNSNWNCKRESINSNEAQLNDDMLLPLIDDMLKCRKEAVDKINSMFGTNITVEFNSAWEDNQIELDMSQENLDIEQTEDAPEDMIEDTTEDAPEDMIEDTTESVDDVLEDIKEMVEEIKEEVMENDEINNIEM